MSAKKNKATVRRILEEVWRKGDLSVIDETYAADFVFTGAPSTKSVLHGPQGYRQLVGLYRTAFPDCHFTVDDLIAEGDTVALRWTFHGTHRGELQGIPPTGKQVANPGTSVTRFKGGKAVEEHAMWDERHMYQQLGIAPPV